MHTDYIYDILKSKLNPHRYAHVMGVKDTAVKLAKVYGADPEKAELAALFHDMYKYLDTEQSNEMVRELGLGDQYIDNTNLAHSKIAAAMMEKKFHIDDQDVINAVKYHTTGRPGMSLLEKIIFIADAIEPGRDYPGVERLRQLAPVDLDRACYESLDATEKIVRKRTQNVDSDTVEAVRYYRNLLEKEKRMDSKEKALLAANVLLDKKAKEVTLIDIAEKSSFADYFVIATGGSERQVAALSDEVQDKYAENGIMPKNIEGRHGTGWILMDFGDVIVNVFTEENRSKYNIEKVWGDCSSFGLEEEK